MGAFDATDAFVTKLNAAGSALVYSTYLGGAEVDFATHPVVDPAGSAYVVGSTRSPNFPTTAGAFDTTHNGRLRHLRHEAERHGLWPPVLHFRGRTGHGHRGKPAVDGGGTPTWRGGTISPDHPTTAGTFDRTPVDSEAFVTKLNAAGSALVYSTFVGGTGGEGASGVVVDGAGNAWIAGGTDSADFPMAGASFDTSINGGTDAFVAELDAAGSALLYSTFLGGSLSEGAANLAFDPGGNVIVTGRTVSADFPTTPGAWDRVFHGDPLIFWADAFVTKLAVGQALPPPPPAAPTLLSPANGGNPAQPVTFDWSDVGGAASYTIQVDDSSSFTAPLVAQQSATTSLATIGGLSTVRHWWRVRGVNSAGAAGAWSTVWTFTPQAAPPLPRCRR